MSNLREVVGFVIGLEDQDTGVVSNFRIVGESTISSAIEHYIAKYGDYKKICKPIIAGKLYDDGSGYNQFEFVEEKEPETTEEKPTDPCQECDEKCPINFFNEAKKYRQEKIKKEFEYNTLKDIADNILGILHEMGEPNNDFLKEYVNKAADDFKLFYRLLSSKEPMHFEEFWLVGKLNEIGEIPLEKQSCMIIKAESYNDACNTYEKEMKKFGSSNKQTIAIPCYSGLSFDDILHNPFSVSICSQEFNRGFVGKNLIAVVTQGDGGATEDYERLIHVMYGAYLMKKDISLETVEPYEQYIDAQYWFPYRRVL